MHFSLADSPGKPVITKVPTTPLASTPSTFGGITLQLYVAQRAEPGAVLVVFALQVSPAAGSYNFEAIEEALSQNGLGASAAVSGVSLFDPVGLKEYETFMADPTSDATCLCSSIAGSSLAGGPGNPKGTFYYAALVAAPPSSVTSVSFVTGMGSIANVTLSA